MHHVYDTNAAGEISISALREVLKERSAHSQGWLGGTVGGIPVPLTLTRTPKPYRTNHFPYTVLAQTRQSVPVRVARQRSKSR